MATLDYSKALKEYREKVFISQKELAQFLGVSFSIYLTLFNESKLKMIRNRG